MTIQRYGDFEYKKNFRLYFNYLKTFGLYIFPCINLEVQDNQLIQ